MTQSRTLGEILFRWRDLLPVPLVAVMARVARPSLLSWLMGIPLILAGEILRLWSLMHIGPTTRTREICADRLVTSGPYSLTRNPLYLANILKITGFLTIAGNLPFAALVLSFYLIEYSQVIPFEESFLAGKFPTEFAQYKARVPVLLPDGLRPRPDPAPHSFSEALRSERKTFASSGLLLATLLLVQFLKRGIRE